MSTLNDETDSKVTERESLIRDEDGEDQEVNPEDIVAAAAPVKRERVLADGCDTDELCCCWVPIKVGF